jgi:hypothetical protein
MRYANLLTIFAVNTNCYSVGRIEADCTNYWGTSRLLTSACKHSTPSRSSLKVNSIRRWNFTDPLDRFRRNRARIDQIFCIREIIEETEGTVKQDISYLQISRSLKYIFHLKMAGRGQTCSGYKIVIKTFRKILLLLTVPPKIIASRLSQDIRVV